ncbi:hypothetical protein DFH08DRAFT_800628 [Mycena albidolilacea]|uniref:Uncharacterized protein n=1 Tax=Mycena albidolilacea TaxID=1033008 RepID=A0AAD7AKF6_9AGAR|nr:hypothetical protein DFH08DRAFT_800628 [Mycena albidolilacea]
MSSVTSENSRKILKTAEGMGDIGTAKSHCGIWPLYSALGMKRTVAESFGRNKTQFQERQAVYGGGSEAARAAASGKKRTEEQPSQSRDLEHTELQPRCDRSCTIIAGMHRKLPRNVFRRRQRSRKGSEVKKRERGNIGEPDPRQLDGARKFDSVVIRDTVIRLLTPEVQIEGQATTTAQKPASGFKLLQNKVRAGRGGYPAKAFSAHRHFIIGVNAF